MIELKLTGNERLQFQYILPAQGNITTLNQVKTVLDIVRIEEVKEITDDILKIFEFDSACINMMKNQIQALDGSNQLRLESLPLINKILNTKEL